MTSETQNLRAGSVARFAGNRGTDSDVIVTSRDDQLFLLMEGYQTTFVSVAQGQTSTENPERLLLSHMVWRP